MYSYNGIESLKVTNWVLGINDICGELTVVGLGSRNNHAPPPLCFTCLHIGAGMIYMPLVEGTYSANHCKSFLKHNDSTMSTFAGQALKVSNILL